MCLSNQPCTHICESLFLYPLCVQCPEDGEEYAEAAVEWSVEALPPHIQSTCVFIHIPFCYSK
jgi:hypothetical protein